MYFPVWENHKRKYFVYMCKKNMSLSHSKENKQGKRKKKCSRGVQNGRLIWTLLWNVNLNFCRVNGFCGFIVVFTTCKEALTWRNRCQVRRQTSVSFFLETGIRLKPIALFQSRFTTARSWLIKSTFHALKRLSYFQAS